VARRDEQGVRAGHARPCRAGSPLGVRNYEQTRPLQTTLQGGAWLGNILGRTTECKYSWRPRACSQYTVLNPTPQRSACRRGVQLGSRRAAAGCSRPLRRRRRPRCSGARGPWPAAGCWRPARPTRTRIASTQPDVPPPACWAALSCTQGASIVTESPSWAIVQPRKGYADTPRPGLQAGLPGAVGPINLARARRRDICASRLARARDAGKDAQRAAALGRGRAWRLQHAQARAGGARRHERGELAGARVERMVPQQHARFLLHSDAELSQPLRLPPLAPARVLVRGGPRPQRGAPRQQACLL
jgi:hypothetical protein